MAIAITKAIKFRCEECQHNQTEEYALIKGLFEGRSVMKDRITCEWCGHVNFVFEEPEEYRVSVEKFMYSTGFVTVKDCNSPEEAEDFVAEQIISGRIQTTSIEWSEPQYEEGTFSVTHDVDIVLTQKE